MNVSVQFDRNSDEPMYVQLYKEFKSMIEKGDLFQNQKLPPIRKISKYLGINNSTVVNAYKLLENNGYAYSRPGSGTFVLTKSRNVTLSEKYKLEYDIIEPKEIRVRSDSINFSSSNPDPELFPIMDFKKVLNEVLDRDEGQAFSYTEVRGYKPLRENIACYMNAENVKCHADNIQIISGAQQGIDIIAKVLIDFGDIIVTERPTYTGAIAVFKSRGARILDIPIGVEGIDLIELEKKLKESTPKFIYIMTNYQNPTGYSYSEKSKEKLLYLADKYDFFIIEDDYLSELCYLPKKSSSLKSMDYNERVIYIKSFSKIFMPGVRLGFLIVPQKVQERVLAAKHLSDISTSGFIQRVFELYIKNNMLNNHIDNIKSKYFERYSAITKYLDTNIKNISYYKPEGGIHLWLKLPDSLGSNTLYTQCLTHNVIISPGSVFFLDEIDSPYFRICFASTNTDIINRGVNILSSTICELQNMKFDYENIPFI